VGYGLVRLVERFDDSDTVKFVYIRWVGENIHRMLRARLGTHSGAIKGPPPEKRRETKRERERQRERERETKRERENRVLLLSARSTPSKKTLTP
jgi:hypothetical protein